MGTSNYYSEATGNGKFMNLADGENLVFRYQEMLKRRKLNPNVIHIPNLFVWHQNVSSVQAWSAVRVNYYTSVVGSDDKIAEYENQISKVLIPKRGEPATQMCPRVFKKAANSKKSKIVDISIAIDALRHSYHGHVEAIMLLSGDGDYLPLVKEIMRSGTRVWLGAFSDGLDPRLPSAVDRFIDLDKIGFFND